ncbi:MAG: phosphoadenosine phosphosulfate reductase family protein [Christensenellaceae bacterium]
MIYWCNACEVPVFSNEICPACGLTTRYIASTAICNPVFAQERRLMSFILEYPVDSCNVWYLGSGHYLIDGKRVMLPFVDFYKKRRHFLCAESLRENIMLNDDIPNQKNYLKANKRYLLEKIFEAESYIVEQIEICKKDTENDYIPTVSFSGGKDSTVVSRIVRDALQTENIIHYFGDTTLEFPSTYQYVKNSFRQENPIPPMIPSETENDFFKLCKVFGPPSRFERWCCTIFKTSNLNTEFQNLAGNSLTFLGIRRSESNERKSYERTQKKSKIGTQINAMPIIDWLDYDVWLYIIYKGLTFNDAYRYGYKRVGCWCCPNNSDWAGLLTEIYYPKLANRWKDVLYDFAQKTGKSEIAEYVENGKWKMRKGSSGLESKNITIADTPCNLSDRARNIIIKKKIERDVLEFFKPFGRVDAFDKEDASYISIIEQDITEDGQKINNKKICDLVIVYGTTVIKVLPVAGIDSTLLVNRIKCQMRKYQFCIRCTACDSVCPHGAINTIGSERYTVDQNKCKQNLSVCSKCIAKFYNGCITCQVLAGKKNAKNDSSEM